jgi:2-phosphoglycerate kinase
VGDELIERGLDQIEIERLEALAVEMLGEEKGRETIQRLRRYQELRELDLPIMVFVGGATGTGKSTVATELAYRFGITRVTSTDFVRQTMRAFFSQAFMPSIHQSSFEAGDAFPDADDPLEFGFLQQARNVNVGVRASSERALEEGWSLVLEGVHLVPGMVELPRPELAVSVFAVLAIDDEEEHARHFHYRDEDSDQRPESRYLERFADIRRLQELIVARARREEVPVIENDDADSAARQVADLVLDAAERIRTVAR